MKEKINNICLDYGDALVHLYQFNFFNKRVNDESVLHDHKFYEIHLAIHGSYTYKTDDKEIILKENQMLIIPPSVYHASVRNTDWNYNFSVLSFSISKNDGEAGFFEFFQNALNSCALTPINIPPHFIKRVTEISRGELYGVIKGECYLKMHGTAIIYELFDILNQFENSNENKRCAKKETDRLVLLDMLINDSKKGLSDIATAINYSPRHTARLIKSVYGVSLSELRKKQSIVSK